MALRYCSLHGRVFSFTQQCWAPFPEKKIDEIQAYYALLRTPKTEPFSLHVVETGCDECVAAFQQLTHIRGATDGLHPGAWR
jgi:hypothetical protein